MISTKQLVPLGQLPEPRFCSLSPLLCPCVEHWGTLALPWGDTALCWKVGAAALPGAGRGGSPGCLEGGEKSPPSGQAR